MFLVRWARAACVHRFLRSQETRRDSRGIHACDGSTHCIITRRTHTTRDEATGGVRLPRAFTKLLFVRIIGRGDVGLSSSGEMLRRPIELSARAADYYELIN